MMNPWKEADAERRAKVEEWYAEQRRIIDQRLKEYDEQRQKERTKEGRHEQGTV